MSGTPRTDIELLAQDIRRQPELLASVPGTFRERTARLASQTRRPSRIYVVGCGDSLNVGMAVRFEWERLTGIPVHAIPALTFSRFEVRNVPTDALVIALSQSGNVVRVIEAARAARARGATTISVSGVPSSPLMSEPASARLSTDFPKLGFVPGTTSFPYHLAIFYQLGLALAEAWGIDSDTGSGRRNLDLAPRLVGAALDTMWETARDHAAAFRGERPLLILGSGPNLASALFVARKMFEVPQVVALAQETEEYAHDEYSIVSASVPSMLIAPNDSAATRSREIYSSLANLGSPTSVVSDDGGAWDPQPTWCYRFDRELGALDELYSPLIATLPGQLLTYELARAMGGSFYATADPVHSRDGDALIYGSELITTP